MNPLVKISNALCRIGRHAVLRIDEFEIGSGEHWCVFGPNGSGKSVLAGLLAGKRVESGSYVSYRPGFDPARDIHIVSFEEQRRLWQRDNRLDVSEYSARAEDAGTVVASLIQSSRPGDSQNQALFDQLIEQLGLGAVVAKGIRFLSSGQLRKVLIARALYAFQPGVPRLLILDDPLESIDRDSRQRIAHCIETCLGDGFSSLQLCRRARAIMPGVTHIAVMRDLRIIERGPRDEVMASTAFSEVSDKQPCLPDRLPAAADRAGGEVDLNAPLIRLENVDAGYGELQVLSQVNWTMEAGDHVLIEGPNGCGKSTLLSLINGENHKGYGQQVYLFGRLKGSGETVWEVKAGFGLVSNELHNKYVKGWKVLDVVVSGFHDSIGLYDDSGALEIDLARQWLRALGISDLEKHYYHEISFGQQRLVLLARAMVKHPRVLILDEPCVGLDDYHRDLILRILDLIAAETDTRVIYVSHVADEYPTCINQRLRFVEGPRGVFTLSQTAVNPDVS